MTDDKKVEIWDMAYKSSKTVRETLLDIYELGRTDAERDFQNSDYWNDYLGKVIADARADERREISEILNSPGDAETIVMMLTNYMVRHTIRDALKNRGTEE